MVRLNKNTQNALVYGTDGEKALGEGFGRPLPYIIQGKACEIILSDILGKDIGSAREPGLVDCESPTDFDRNLDRLSNECHLLHPLGERFVT